MVQRYIVFVFVLASLLLAACAPAPTATPVPAPASQVATSAAKNSSVSSASASSVSSAASSASASASSAATSSSGASTVPSDTVKLVIVPSASEARYRVREVLAGNTLPNDAVGATKTIDGTIFGKMDGSLVSAQSKFRVDLRTLKSDQGMRDQFIQGGTLSTAQYPYAEFVPTETKGLPKTLPADGKVNFQLVGNMTIRGVTKPLTWDVTSQANGDVVTGKATTKFEFSLFNITKPSVARVLSIEDTVQLELDFTLQRVYN